MPRQAKLFVHDATLKLLLQQLYTKTLLHSLPVSSTAFYRALAPFVYGNSLAVTHLQAPTTTQRNFTTTHSLLSLKPFHTIHFLLEYPIITAIMSRFNELGIDIGQATKLAHTNLTSLNGHTTLWTGTQREHPEEESEDPGDKDDAGSTHEAGKSEAGSEAGDCEEPPEGRTLPKASYYGDVDLGPATRSTFHQVKYSAAVAFVVEPAEEIDHFTTINSLQLNGPIACMTARERLVLKEITDNPAAAILTPAAKAAHIADSKLCEPTENDIFKHIFIAMAKYPELTPMSGRKLRCLRDHLREDLYYSSLTPSFHLGRFPSPTWSDLRKT